MQGSLLGQANFHGETDPRESDRKKYFQLGFYQVTNRSGPCPRDVQCLAK